MALPTVNQLANGGFKKQDCQSGHISRKHLASSSMWAQSKEDMITDKIILLKAAWKGWLFRSSFSRSLWEYGCLDLRSSIRAKRMAVGHKSWETGDQILRKGKNIKKEMSHHVSLGNQIKMIPLYHLLNNPSKGYLHLSAYRNSIMIHRFLLKDLKILFMNATYLKTTFPCHFCQG